MAALVADCTDGSHVDVIGKDGHLTDRFEQLLDTLPGLRAVRPQGPKAASSPYDKTSSTCTSRFKSKSRSRADPNNSAVLAVQRTDRYPCCCKFWIRDEGLVGSFTDEGGCSRSSYSVIRQARNHAHARNDRQSRAAKGGSAAARLRDGGDPARPPGGTFDQNTRQHLEGVDGELRASGMCSRASEHCLDSHGKSDYTLCQCSASFTTASSR